MGSRTTIRLGTRGSKLALAQAQNVRDLIKAGGAEADVEIVTIRTSGDNGNREVLGAFVKEIQEALLDDRVDIALHCLKDLPTRQLPGVAFAAHLVREDPSDLLITRGPKWKSLPNGSTVGTGSIRRTSQLASLRSDLRFKPLVGNVDTRMRKLQEGDYDAIVLARAGLARLGLLERWQDSEYSALHFESLDILPAPGQAVLVLEVAEGSPFTALAAHLNDPDTQQASIAERSFLRHFGTGCSMPVAARATVRFGSLLLDGLVASLDGQKVVRGAEEGYPTQAEQIGVELAERLCSQGARGLIPGGAS